MLQEYISAATSSDTIFYFFLRLRNEQFTYESLLERLLFYVPRTFVRCTFVIFHCKQHRCGYQNDVALSYLTRLRYQTRAIRKQQVSQILYAAVNHC